MSVLPAERIPLLNHARFELNRRRQCSVVPQLWSLLDSVKDPELPVLSLWDLGILQDIQQAQDLVTVVITPTYSGCPAIEVMAEDIECSLREHGVTEVKVETRLSPAWTTDWLTESGKRALRDYGIAAPGRCGSDRVSVNCPQCGSERTELLSEFSATACKALYRCRSCAEPFDYFKAL
ncbi:MAG: 1,2-phenylacetyl-CoA epoxidase subunit PaaD [Pseudomonadales bacterium]